MKLYPRVLAALIAIAPLPAVAAHSQRVAQVTAAGMAEILAPPQMPGLGAANGAITVVEYFDYNCPYCRAMAPDFRHLVKLDPDLRVLFKDWPIFGPISRYAARAGLAANYQGKYLVAHRALLATPQRLSSIKQIRRALQAAGIDLTVLDADLQKHGAAIDALLARDDQEAQALGLEGTPGLLVGDLLIPGAIRLKELQGLIARLRKGAAK